MGRARKRHVQQELPKLDKNGQRRGGRRAGAGRKPKGRKSSERHGRRPRLNGHEPVLVTVRMMEEVGNVRRRNLFRAVRNALVAVIEREDFRVVHFSIQHNHLHLLVEAKTKTALSRGMQALLISAAKHINAELSKQRGERRRGQVFADRFHARVITNPRQCRNALSYVLNNWRRHGEHRAYFARNWAVDPFSSAVNFPGWKEIEDSPFLLPVPETYERPVTAQPRTWLLRVGWQRHGLIRADEVPGPAPN